ncbi:MAG TPA: hypothetical protein VG963_19425, partial [Polyangiaceae bacterium]|nr:hypothetical protein [Polyangiaceae bacterium]
LVVNAGRASYERSDLVYSVGAVGASGEIHAGIDDLRQAARRGDWLMFWLWPILFSCAFGGMWFLSAGLLLDAPRWLWVLITAFILLPIGCVWFAAWAAIYTNIDAGTAQPISGQEQGPKP